MKYLLILFLLFSSANAAFLPATTIIDPNTEIPAKVTTNNELRVLQTSPIPLVFPSGSPLPVTVTNFPSPVPTQSVFVVNQPTPSPTITVTGQVTIPTPVPVTGTFWQTTQPVSGNLGRTWDLSQLTDSASCYEGGSWTVDSWLFSGTGTSITSTGSYLDVEVHGIPSPSPTITVAGSILVGNTVGAPVPVVVQSPIAVSNFPTPSPTITVVLASPIPLPVSAPSASPVYVDVVNFVTPSPTITVSGQVVVGNTVGAPVPVVVPSPVAVTQSTSPWVTSRNWNLSSGSDSVSSVQSGAWTTGRTWNLSSSTDSVNVGNFPTTYPVTQSTSPWVVSGSITVGNTVGSPIPVVVQSPVAISNFPTPSPTITVAGSITVGNTTGSPVPVVMASPIPSGTNPVGYLSGEAVYTTFTQNYTGSNLSTGAFTTIISSTASTINNTGIFDNSGGVYYLAYAASCGSLSTSSNAIIVSPGGGGYNFLIPSGNCLGFEAIGSSITLGTVYMTFYK